MNPLSLNLSLTDAFKTYRRRIAYEQLLLDALHGNPTLFVRGDETEAAWKWIDGIEAGWKESRMKPEPYWAGSNGPDRAEAFWCRGHKA
jgi:glucose-6-phosphate 1-dehydrogenase